MSSREKTIALFVGVVVGLYALDSVLFSPLLARLTTADDAVIAARAQLTKGEETQQESVRVRRRWRDLGGNSLTTDSAAAENQVFNRVRECASAAGVSLTSVKPERTDREKDFQRIVVRATATGSMQQVAKLLYLIDRSKIPLRVSDVRLTARKENTDDLQLDLGVATIFLPPAPVKPEASR